MKPEQQKIAIAENYGWVIENYGPVGYEALYWRLRKPDGSIRCEGCTGEEFSRLQFALMVPDYVNDWSTRPAMLALLESRELARHIVNNVCVLMARPAELPNTDLTDSHLWMCLSVPQQVFAEAFLVTLNLWKS